jgi:agmatine deiminase
MPAEWERHHATWIGWPHNTSDWPGRFGPIPWVYAEIVRRLAPGEIVRILVNSADHERAARRVLERAGVMPDRVEYFRFPTNRGWTRDFGPIFVKRAADPGRKPGDHESRLAIARFRFNAWAKYPDWKKDDRIPEQVAARLELPLFPARARGRDIVLEGGSIDVNGRGSLLTTEECLLDPTV